MGSLFNNRRNQLHLVAMDGGWWGEGRGLSFNGKYKYQQQQQYFDDYNKLLSISLLLRCCFTTSSQIDVSLWSTCERVARERSRALSSASTVVVHGSPYAIGNVMHVYIGAKIG